MDEIYKKKRGPGRPFVKNAPRINRRGRPTGIREKMSNALVDACFVDWMEHGQEAIEIVREKDPSTYVRVAMMMMPKEIKQDIEVNDSQERVAEVDWEVITGSKTG